jgi:hypothetical protein
MKHAINAKTLATLGILLVVLFDGATRKQRLACFANMVVRIGLAFDDDEEVWICLARNDELY